MGLTFALMLVCIAITATQMLYHVDLAFFDFVSRVARPAAARKVVAVVVDGHTIERLGDWPFSRDIRARMIDRLAGNGVAAVRVDLTSLYADGSDGENNAASRDTTARDKETRPYAARDIEEIRAGVRDVDTVWTGFSTHEAIAPEARQGVTRSSHSSIVGAMDRQLSFVPALLAGALSWQPGFDIPADTSDASEADHVKPAAESCSRLLSVRCSEPYETYSYIDVLQGKVPSSKLSGRLILIGSATRGPGARLMASTAGGFWRAGIDVAAGEIDTLTPSTMTREVDFKYKLLFNEIVVCLICVLLYLLGPRAGLLAVVGMSTAIAGTAFLLFKLEYRVVPPATGIFVCAVAYMLWTWRRLEALLRFMALEAERMAAEPSLPAKPSNDRFFIDPVQRQLNTTAELDERVRRYRELVDEWVDSLPEATLIASTAGTVILANERAAILSKHPGVDQTARGSQAGRSVSEVLFQITASHRAIEFVSQALASLDHWSDGGDLPVQTESLLDQGIEIANARGGLSLLIKCAPIKPSAYREGALIFHVADVSSVRMAERQRDMALRFLSHDMRSPQASILALVAQALRDPSRYTPQKFAELVSQYATRALSLSDDFLFLAKAESLPPKLAPVDPALVLGDAIDDLLPQASEKSTVVNLIAEPGQTTIADAQLLRRAFANLIGNAIKFSPESSTVDVHLSETEHHLKISVADHGIGISEQDRGKLFREFTQLHGKSPSSGHGLGLAFVKTVVDSLGGKLLVQSKLGEGATFLMFLPKHDHGAG